MKNGDKVFATHSINKGLISLVYKTTLKNWGTKKVGNKKMGQRMDNSLKEYKNYLYTYEKMCSFTPNKRNAK